MASTINASNSGFGGIVSTGDSSGQLQLQAASTTVATITTNGMTVAGAFSCSGALGLPTWTTLTRPLTPATGTQGFNTTTSIVEYYNGSSWQGVAPISLVSITASYLIVAGGGSGGGNTGGGGGAGGLLTGSTTLTSGTTYSFTVGAGGAAIVSTALGNAGSNSTGFGLTAIGGGYGGAYSGLGGGGSGGSGGGGGNSPLTSGGAGTAGQGYAGGTPASSSNPYATAGGGGAGGVGAASTGTTVAGAGGVGAITTIITTAIATSASVGQVVSSSVYFAGGGGGSGYSGVTGGAGGNGGGGSGITGGNSVSGTANSGGGGGGNGNTGYSGAGGSGVVIVSIPTALYTGTTTGSPTVVTNGSNTVLIFKSSGSYTA